MVLDMVEVVVAVELNCKIQFLDPILRGGGHLTGGGGGAKH